ncbi:MAG: AAA family ATPase [Methanomicrobiales archaeon]|jgi:AAA15 family ATPase/GTPase|nr:AAA family ATPase [Methanomicrobiales archaeon]
MIESIHFEYYKKLKDLDLSFDKRVTVISGVNGTCKTSLLHIISNAFQKVTSRCEWIKNDDDGKKGLDPINSTNNSINPKIEKLARGDKRYNNPAPGHKGSLYVIRYTNGVELKFRPHTHVNKKSSRHSIKPPYGNKQEEKLPFCPVIYLGLSRLYPFGEFQDDEAIKDIVANLPETYQKEINDLYYKFTHIRIASSSPQNMGSIKKRHDFTPDEEKNSIPGVDSNTISAGEESLLILLNSLVSLKYYYEVYRESYDKLNLEKEMFGSILLIDELDATFHPSYQSKILQYFLEYSKKYNIQIIFTTHSLSLLESALRKKNCTVIYLRDNGDRVNSMLNPDIFRIRMHLFDKTRDETYANAYIPIFTEDEEARFLLEMLFDHYKREKEDFRHISDLLYLVTVNLGVDPLIELFICKSKGNRYVMNGICVLDGDVNGLENNDNIRRREKIDRSKNANILTFFEKDSPERFLWKYATKLYEEPNSNFWEDPFIVNNNTTKRSYLSIKSEVDEVGNERGELKGIFNKNKSFFKDVFTWWLKDEKNKNEVDRFYNEFAKLFQRVAGPCGINPHELESLGES